MLTRMATCEYLDISHAAMHRMRERGELSPVKMGGKVFFLVSELDAYVDALADARDGKWT